MLFIYCIENQPSRRYDSPSKHLDTGCLNSCQEVKAWPVIQPLLVILNNTIWIKHVTPMTAIQN